MRPQGIASSPKHKTKGYVGLIAAILLLGAAGCSRQQSAGSTGQPDIANETPSGTVTMRQVQAAFIASGGGGTGTLYFNGRSYPFRVGGLGIGGIGASTIEAQGDVYHLNSVGQFPGAYAQGR